MTFCTLESAEKAQRALHGNKVLPGVRFELRTTFELLSLHSLCVHSFSCATIIYHKSWLDARMLIVLWFALLIYLDCPMFLSHDFPYCGL